MRKQIVLFVFCLATIALGAQNHIVNGSFEYGINSNWEHRVESPGKVDFTLATNSSAAPMDGERALNVKTNRVGITQMKATSTTQMTAGTDTLYLLRFWAKGNARNTNNEPSRILVEIEGSETPGVLFEMHPGRTIFHLPFKAQPHTGLKIRFQYQDQNITYALDGVEVLGEKNNESIDVLNTYIWQHNRTGNGWVAGDNDISLLLPDGRTIWFFNDSFVGGNDVTKNRMVNGSFVRNAVVIQETDGTLNTLSGFTNVGGQTAYFQPPVPTYNGRPTLLWVGDAILLNDTVNVHLVEVYDDGNGNCVADNKSYMGQFAYPELEYLGMKQRADFCSPYETYFVENDTLYSYKTETDWLARYTHAARTPLSNLFGEKPWEFWNGTAWVNDETQSARINDMGSDGVIQLSEGNYAHVAMSGLDPSVWLSFAQTPQGPWTTKKAVYTHPNDSNGWWYMPNFHAPLSNGNYSISYSTNYHYDWGHNALQSWIDKYWYRQHYIQVDLLGLSPYSRRDCAGVFFGEAWRDECGECVGGTTGKEACITGIAKLYDGCNYTGKAAGLNPGSYTSADLQTLGFPDNALASIELQEGYVVELFENGNFDGETKVLGASSDCLDEEAFSGKTSSLIVRHTGKTDAAGIYTIRNKQSGLYLSVRDQSRSNGALIEQASFTGDESQKFELKEAGNGFYNIVNVASNLSLSTAGFSKQPKAATELWNGLDFSLANLGGLISSQHNAAPGYAVENLIDNQPATSFITYNKPTWVQFQAVTPQTVSKYSLTSSSENSQRDPKNWTLSASNDEVNWTELDKVSDFAFSARMEEQTFEIENETPYAYYRLNMEPRIGQTLQLAEWKLSVASTPEGRYYSKDFIVKDAGNDCVQFINRNSGLVLSVFEDGIIAEGAWVVQMPDMGQTAALWEPVLGTAIETFNTKQSPIVVYPNPVKETLHLNLSADWTGSRLVIYSVHGNAVYSGIALKTLPVDRLNPGYYILKLYKENDAIVTHFIKQ
jgi:hypothetical protein